MDTLYALYIHVPFCRHKCSYCDFYSTIQLAAIPRYLAALHREIEHLQTNPPAGGFVISTLYMGGGTPSLLSPVQIQSLLERIKIHWPFAANAEITLEANPGALDDGHLAAYRNSGVNRLSIGIQSFQDDELVSLTRIHSADEAKASFMAARAAGFDNLSLDLIFGLPNQTITKWDSTLRQALELAPEHISMYGLTIEPGTPLHQDYTKGKLSKCDEELEREMFLHGKATLESAGYEHYEISNYAKPGYSARHNQHYWDGSPYLGLGPAAHSFVNGVRWWNVRDLSAYCRAWEENTSAVAGKEVLTALQRRAETIILGLRQRQGIDLKAWEKTFAESPMSLFSSAMDKLGGYATDNLPFANAPSSQLLTCHDGRLALTTQGVLLYDLVCKELYDVCC